MPWRLLLSLACLLSVIMMFASKRAPRNPVNQRLFLAIRIVLLVSVVVLFYLAFFHHTAA